LEVVALAALAKTTIEHLLVQILHSALLQQMVAAELGIGLVALGILVALVVVLHLAQGQLLRAVLEILLALHHHKEITVEMVLQLQVLQMVGGEVLEQQVEMV
jgi:hypothetical protein